MKRFSWNRKSVETGCSAVVVAAGASARMGENKLLLRLNDIPVIVHTLRALQSAPSVNDIVLVTRDDMMETMKTYCQQYELIKVVSIVLGGKNRTESVQSGINAVRRDAELIAIHDGDRPFVTKEVIEQTILQASKTGAAAPAVPVKDTIKIAKKGVVVETPERSTLFAVQTPQIFEASLIRAAIQKAIDDEVDLTDDCAAVERLGMKIVLTDGDEHNIKLTTPADYSMAVSWYGGSES